MIEAHNSSLVAAASVDRQAATEEIGEGVCARAAPDPLPVDDHDRGAAGCLVEEQVVTAEVLVQQSPRPITEGTHQAPIVVADLLAGRSCALGQAISESGRERRP